MKKIPMLTSFDFAQLSTTQLVERSVASRREVETNGYGKFITRIDLSRKFQL